MMRSRLQQQQRGVFSSRLAAVILLLWGTATSAQANYTILPAGHQDVGGAVKQPTGHNVTLLVRDSTLEYVINELGRQAHLKLVYAGNPALVKRVTVHITDMTVMDAFARVLRGTGLTAQLASDGATVAIIPQSGAVPTARVRIVGGSIVGRVTDSASGRGINGVTVKVTGTTLSTVTADSGHFLLREVPAGEHVLTMRVFGYKPVTRVVTVVDSQRTTVNIVMVSVTNILSGVVTTATGTQRRIEVGNDITSLNVDSIMQVAPITSVTDLLDTRVPGLTVLHSSGTPGDPSRLRLRGTGSIILNNDPIVIVDGIRVYASQSDVRNRNLAQSAGQSGSSLENLNPSVERGSSIQAVAGGYSAPSPLDQIDPATIETIEVLKGPSATATYGSDAAGGVIVITTKHGRAGPTQWSLALIDGVNWNPGSWPVNYYRFGRNNAGPNALNNTGTSTSGLCLWYQPGCTVDSLVPFQALNDPRYTLFSHGNNQQANLTISGGSQTVTYSVTGSGASNVGLLKLPAIEQHRYDSAYGPIPHYLLRPDNYTNWGVNGSLAVLPSSRVRVTLQSSLFTSVQQQSSLANAITQLEAIYINPTLLTGLLIGNEVERATDNAVTSTNALSFDWQLMPWLPLRAIAGTNTIERIDNTYIPHGVNACLNVGNGRSDNTCNVDTAGSYGLGRGTSHDKTLSIGTQIPLRFVTLGVGGNIFSQSTADISVYTNQLSSGVSVPTIFLLDDGQNAPTNYSTASQSTYGWYVEPKLNFKSKFFVTPGFRLDGGSGGSTSSGSVGGLSAFPKIDLSYFAVDRQGQHPLWGVLSQLRPRLAFGLSGIQPDPSQKLRLFNIGSLTLNTHEGTANAGLGSAQACNPALTLDGTTTVPGVCLDVLGNTQLRPERTREIEGGFDATLWNGRVSLTYSQYNKTTQDAIVAIPVAPSVDGGWNIQKNIGVVRNTGTEITVETTILQSRAMSWNVGVNLSNNNSLVVRLNPGQLPICFGGGAPCNGTRIVAGYPIDGLWAQPIASFADVNHDHILEQNEIHLGDSAVYVGQPNPKYQFNLNTGLALFSGLLTVNATLAYQNGLTQNNAAACQSGGFTLLPNAPNTPLATQAAIVAANCGLISYTSLSNTPIGLIQTVNTFRFKDLSINYNVPRAVSTWFHVPHMTLALQGSNLALHTNYRGIDPDVNAFSTVSSGDETADLGQLPEPRTWWLRMELKN